MRHFRTFNETLEEHYRQHPEELDSFLSVAFEEYAQDKDTAALLSALRLISRVKGVSSTAGAAHMTRKGVQKALTEGAKPRFESIAAILDAMGYCLVPKPTNTHSLPLQQ